MIYFTKVEVDRMVDFIIKKENLYNLRHRERTWPYPAGNLRDFDKSPIKL